MDKVKIVVFVPEGDADSVRKAIGDAGAGKIGNYIYCSFSVEGAGRYMPLKGTKPTIGKVGKLEKVKEVRVEVVCDRKIAKEIIKEIKKAHPYEEVALDIYPLISEKDL